MGKCSHCQQEFPHFILVDIVHIVAQKAYLGKYCPTCRAIVTSNPSYYVLAENKDKFP